MFAGSAVDGAYPSGITRLLDEARADVDELVATGRISKVAGLAQRTGLDFDPTYFPMYFTGAFSARLVLVHLNPKLSVRLGGTR